MKRVAYYQGCSLEGLAAEYDRSTRAVCKALGIELVEIPDWNCCGSSPAHSHDEMLGAALSARNLALAEAQGLDVVMTPCPACLKALKGALEVYGDESKRQKLLDIVGMPFSGKIKAISVLQLLYEEDVLEAIRTRAVQPLTGVKIAPYYGCLLTRPAKFMEFDDPENPVSMDRLLEAAGATVPDFPFKTECCGAAFGVTRNETAGRLTGRILDMAERAGADAVAVACPLCQQNLDLRQEQVERRLKRSFNLPVVYVTQVLGLALGLDPKVLGMNKLFVDPGALFRRPVPDAADEERESA